MNLYLRALALSLLCLGSALRAVAQEPPCGSLSNAYGPFDYRFEKNKALEIVNKAHFNSNVERLRSGQSSYLGGDLDYVLRASPNHHRALITLANWGVTLKGQQPPNMPRTIDCYFDRATRFKPEDPIPRMIYVDYMRRLGRKADAMEAAAPLLKVEHLEAFTHNNLGMLMFDLGEYEKALEQAHLAIAGGWQREDLMDRLKSVGRWHDPTPEAANAASAPMAASAAAPAAAAASSEPTR